MSSIEVGFEEEWTGGRWWAELNAIEYPTHTTALTLHVCCLPFDIGIDLKPDNGELLRENLTEGDIFE